MSELLTPQQRIKLGPDETWFPDGAPSKRTVRWATAQEARKRILSEPYLETDQAEILIGATKHSIKSMTASGILLAYADHGEDLFPALQFDPETREPFPIVSEVNYFLAGPGDGWRVTNWWLKPHEELHGDTPEQALAKPRLGDHHNIRIAAIATDRNDPSYGEIAA